MLRKLIHYRYCNTVRIFLLLSLKDIFLANCYANGFSFISVTPSFTELYSADPRFDQLPQLGQYSQTNNQPPNNDVFFRPYVIPLVIVNDQLLLANTCSGVILGNQLDGAGNPIPNEYWLITAFNCFDAAAHSGYFDNFDKFRRLEMFIPTTSFMNPRNVLVNSEIKLGNPVIYGNSLFYSVIRDNLVSKLSFQRVVFSNNIRSVSNRKYLLINVTSTNMEIPNATTTIYHLSPGTDDVNSLNNVMEVGFGIIPSSRIYTFATGVPSVVINDGTPVRVRKLNYSHLFATHVSPFILALQQQQFFPSLVGYRAFNCNGDVGAGLFEFDMQANPLREPNLIGIQLDSATTGTCIKHGTYYDYGTADWIKTMEFTPQDIQNILTITHLTNHP